MIREFSALREISVLDAAFLLVVGSFLLTLELFCLQLCLGAFLLTAGAFLLTIEAFLLTVGTRVSEHLKGLQARKLNCK